MTRIYIPTAKAIEQGYTSEIFFKDAADACRLLHYGDYSDLCVSTWEGMCQRPCLYTGISVSSNDEATVKGFIENWVKLGLLEEVIPHHLRTIHDRRKQ